MEDHKRLLGIFYIVLASIQILAMLILSAVLTTVFSFALPKADAADAEVLQFVTKLVQYIPAIVILFLGIPGLVAGIGLLAKKSWGILFALVIGCLHLLSFPFGTALGIYTIWVYSEDKKLSAARPA